MYRLVAQGRRDYPQFVPLCEALSVKSREAQDGKDVLIADMTVAYKMVRETFTSRVTLDDAEPAILVEYLDGPFRHLEKPMAVLTRGQ